MKCPFSEQFLAKRNVVHALQSVFSEIERRPLNLSVMIVGSFHSQLHVALIIMTFAVDWALNNNDLSISVSRVCVCVCVCHL